MSCTLIAARRRGQSARIFPLRGRYARLLRRSRVAGIAFAPRLAGLVGFFSVCALRGGEHFLMYEDSIMTDGEQIFMFLWRKVLFAMYRRWQQVLISEGKRKVRQLLKGIFLFSVVNYSPEQCTESIGGKPFFLPCIKG